MIARYSLTMAAVLALALAPAALRAEGQSSQAENQGGAGTSGEGQAAATGLVNAETNKVLAELNRVNLAEIEMGKLAKDKAQSASVKKYGEKLVKDHEQAQKKVTDLADQLGIKFPSKDETLAAREKQMAEHLKGLQGAQFDKAFMQHMAEDHTKAITSLEASQKNLTGAAKQLVTELLPVMREHQKTAKQLAQMPASTEKAGQ